MRQNWQHQKRQTGLPTIATLKRWQAGIIEVLPLVLLAVFAAFTFVIAATVQKQQQDIRSRAREAEEGVYAPNEKTPTPTPTPYCSKFMNDDCSFGCIPTISGGTCRTAPQQPSGTITPRTTTSPTPTAAPLSTRITLTPTPPPRTPTPAGPTMRYSVIGGQCRGIYGGGYATLAECVAALNRQLAVSLTPTTRLTPTPDTSCLAQCRGTSGAEAVRCLTECRRNEGTISVTTPTRSVTRTPIPTRTPTSAVTPRPTPTSAPTPTCQFSLFGFCLIGGGTPTPTPTPTLAVRPSVTPVPLPTVSAVPTPRLGAGGTPRPSVTPAPSPIQGFVPPGATCGGTFVTGNTCGQCQYGVDTNWIGQKRCKTAPTPTPTVTATRTPTAPPPRFGTGGTPQPSVTATSIPTPYPTIDCNQRCAGQTGANATGCYRGCNAQNAAIRSGATPPTTATPPPLTPVPTYNACSDQEFAGYTTTECTRRGGRSRAIGGSTVCCTLPGRTPTPPPGTAPAGSLALGATCNVSSECRSGFCDWHMVNGVASGKQCGAAPTVTPTPTFAVLPTVTPTPTPLPIEMGSCDGGVPINGCARAQNNLWVRCSAGRGQGNASGRYTYPYYKEDASCARVDLALVGGGTLTVQLESDTASTDLTADRIQCLNVATFGGSCDNVSFGSCSSDKKYVCDCTYYRYPTFRAATGSEQGSCDPKQPLFTTRSVAGALQEQTVLQQARQASCARGCAVGGSIYGAGYCASAVSQCQCNESTGWQPRLVTVTQDDCRAGGTTTQQIGSAFNTSSGYFCGDDGNVYQNRQSPQLVSFCRNSGLICGTRSTGQIECRGATTLDELANAGLGGSPDIYECIGTTAYRIKSRPSQTTRCPNGTTCQASEGAVQCAPTDQSWQQFLTSYQSSAQAASQCSGGGNHGDSRGSGASAETCMCEVRGNATIPGSCSWRGSAQVATQVLQQSNYPQAYITAFQSYQRDHPGATLADFQQAQVAAFDRIRPTLVNLGVLDQAYMDRISSGEYVPTEIERTLSQQRQNPFVATVLWFNNITSGATKRGNDLLLQGEETWRQGDIFNGANQIVRGALIQGAAPAAIAVAIAALPAIPLAGALAAAGGGALIIPSALVGTLTFGGTAVGIAGTTYSLQHTAEACAPGTLATKECALAAGNTAFAALSTGVGVAAGSLQLAAQANMARSGLALAQGAGAASDAMTGATIANITGRAATIASWNKAVALGGTVLFGSQAIEACTQGVPDDPNNPDGPRHIDSLNCAVNTAMALTSAVRFVGASVGLNPTSLPNKSVEVLDVGVNSTQAIIACAGGAANRDLTGCAQAVSGALLSAGGAYAIGVHRGNLADTPTARFEEARQALADLYVDPNAGPREAQLRSGITPEQVRANEVALRQAIMVQAQERAAVDLALRSIGGSEADWTASQRGLRTAQQDYQAALAAYETLAGKPLAERLASTEYRAYQQALDNLVITKATVNVEQTALRSPRNPLQQLGDRVVRPSEVDSFQRAQDDFRRVAASADPQSLEYRQALDRLVVTQQSVRELTYNRSQQEITAELRPKQEELRNRQGDLTTTQEENALLADPSRAQQAVRDAQVVLDEARTRRAGVSGEAAANADLAIRQIEQRLARAQELSKLATDYASGNSEAQRQVTDRQLREQTLGKQVLVLNAQVARLEGARVQAGTVRGWLADRLLGTPKNPNAFAEVFLGRTSAEVQLTRQLVADQVGRTQAERLVAEARSRVEQNAGLSLNDAVNQVFAEKGRAGVRQEVFDAAASALRQSGITDEAVIARRAGLVAASVTDTLWSGRDRLATSVTSGLAPAQSLDFRLRPTGLAAVGAAITGAGGAVSRSAAGAVIGVSDSLSDLGSNLRVRREAEPATLTPEARNLVSRLAELQVERGITALDTAGEGTSRNALLAAGSEQITTPDGKTATRTRFELTDTGRTAGFTEGDIRLLNQVTRAFEDFQASQNPNFERIRAGTGDFRDQARFVVSALETFGAKGSRGAVFGALPGMGKTDVVMPLNILLQARMTADPQFVVFPDGPLMEQFLRSDGAGNRAMVGFYEQSLGPDSVLVVRQGDLPPTPEQIARAKIIVTTRDIAFTLRETDTPTGAAMRDRWRNSYIHGDEAHWTLNPFESYQVTAGEQRRVLQTSEGSGFVQAKDEVTRLAAVRELIDARIAGRQPEGVTKSPDGRSGVYTPETELVILREWLATRDSAGILPAELKPLVNSSDLPTIQRELNRFLDTNPTQAAGPLGRELTVINKLADVLAAVPGNDYGPSARANEVILAPREQGKITGRQYQSIPEQILYNTVGAEITGSRVDLNTLTVSTQSRDINYALLMFEAKGFALYTGTPELVARMYEQAYGVNLRTFSDSAFDTVSNRLNAGQQAGTSRVFSTLADAARSGEPNRNQVYVNMDTSRANSVVTAEIARLNPDQRLFVVGGNGEFIEYTTDSSGRLSQVQTYPNREALNVRTSALDNAGGRYVKIYEYGAHTGVDTFNDVARSRGIVIAGSDINQTTFAQGVSRLRPDASGTYPPIDIVYLGTDTQTVRTPAELMADLNSRLATNEARSQALGEIQFKETLLRNSVDIMFDRLISRSGETRLLGLVRPDQDLVVRLTSLQDSWKRTSELAYRLGSGEVDAQTRLQRTLEQVQALYRQVGEVVADNPNVASEFNRQAQGFDSATINFVATQAQETSFRVGQPPTLRDIVKLINSTTSTERFANVAFTERGAGPQVITADAAASARAVNIISDIDTPAGGAPVAAVGGGPRVEPVTPQAREQQIAVRVREQEFARLATRFPMLAYQPVAVEAVAAGLPTDQVRARVVEALTRGYTTDILRANFDAWVSQFAAGLVGRAILPKVTADMANGQTPVASDLLLARLASQDLNVQNQVSVPKALPIPIGGQFRVVDNNAQTQTVPLAPETKIEFGVTRITTTVYTPPLTVGTDQKIDLNTVPVDANLVRLTTKDGTQYTVTKDDFLVQTQQQAVAAAVTQQVVTVLTGQPLVPQIFGLRRTGFNSAVLQTPKGQAVVSAVVNLQTGVATGVYQNANDVLGSTDYQSLTRALFDLSQTEGRYRGVSAQNVADAAIVAAGGGQSLLTGKQQPGRVIPAPVGAGQVGAPVVSFFGRVGEATRALFGRLSQAFAGIRLPAGAAGQAFKTLGNWLGQRLTDFGNFFVQATRGLPTFFRRINAQAVRDLFLWKPLSGLMTSPRVNQLTKNILAGKRDSIAERVFNAVPFGIGRSDWSWQNALIDTGLYFLTRNISYVGVAFNVYDGARIARWITEKVTGVPSPLRIQPPAPKEAPPAKPDEIPPAAPPAPKTAPPAPQAQQVLQAPVVKPEDLVLKNTLHPEYQLAVNALPNKLPDEFKKQVRLVAFIFQSLEYNERLETVNGIFLDNLVQRFADTFLQTQYVYPVDYVISVNRGQRDDSRFPAWVTARRVSTPSFDQGQLQKINAYISAYVAKYAYRDQVEPNGHYYYFSPDIGAKVTVPNLAANNKLYIDGPALVDTDKVDAFLIGLRSLKIHPTSLKLFDQDQLTMYWNGALSDDDIQAIYRVAKETGVQVRGPAQDPIYVKQDNGTLSVEALLSNDESLGRGGRIGYEWNRSTYNAQEFFKQWIRLTYNGQKNPADPSRMSFIRSALPDSVSLNDWTEQLKQLDTAGLPIVVNKKLGYAYDPFNPEDAKNILTIIPSGPVQQAPVVKLPEGPLVSPQRIDLPQNNILLGRSDQAQIQLPMAVDTQVSRQHARIGFANGAFNIIDLGSLHGTIILRGNQEIKVTTDKPTTLVKGDIILLARNGTYFRFLGNALDGPHFDGKQALVQLSPAQGRVDKVLAQKLFSDKPMLEALHDRIEGLIFDLDLKEAQNVINDELRSVLEDEGLRGSDLETAKNQLAVRLNVAGLIDDLKERIEVRSRASDMTVPLISRPRYDRVGRLPVNLQPVQQYKYEYVSSGGQKLRIDLVNDPELREMVDRAIREIADIRDKSRSFLGGSPSKSRLDALAEWVNREVNYNKNIQQKIYDAGGGQAGLGQIVCNGGVCREKSFLVDLLARELGLQSEVWVFNFGDGGRHAINYFPQRQLIVDATNETQALTVAEYENRPWVRRIGGINWSSVLRFGHQDAISEEENARAGGKPLYSNPILQVVTGAIRTPLEFLANTLDPRTQTFIGRLGKAATGVDDYVNGRDTPEARRYQTTVVEFWNVLWQNSLENTRRALGGAASAIPSQNNLVGVLLRSLTTLISPNIVSPGAPVGPAEAPRAPPSGPAISQVLASRNISLDRLQSLPNAATVISFITRRLIDPGFQKVLPVAQLPKDLVIYENGVPVAPQRHQEILANYQNNRPGLPIFSSFTLKGLIAAGYQAVNLDIRNLGSANEVGGAPNGIVGDYLIYDTIAAIQKELGDDYLMVRTGGDEFTVLSRQPFTSEITARIQTAAANGQSLFTESGRVVYKPAQVKITLTSPADLAEAEARELPPEELSPGIRMNRLNAYHPELRPITDALVTVQDPQELNNLLTFFEESLFDPILQKEAQQLAVNGKNVEVYVNRTDYINHLQSRAAALRLVRVDLPGALKRINDNHNYTVGNDFLRYEFRQIVAAVAKYQNDIIVFRRGGDFYIALPDNQSLVNAVASEIEKSIRGETGSFPAEEERITLIPALASVKLNLDLVKERTPEVSSTNERVFAVAQEQLAEAVWRATVMQLQRFYSVEHRNPDWEFLLRYVDPYDRRGNNRLVRMATPFIADLQKLYYDPAVDGRSGVREGQVEAAKQQLLQILNGYQYPQPLPAAAAEETQTQIQTFERRVPAPLRLVRVGRDYVTSAYNNVRNGLIQTRRAVNKAVLPEVFQGKDLYQVLAENNTEFEVVPFAVQSMEQVRDAIFRNLRELGFPTEAAMVEKVYSWHAEAIREAETKRGRPEYPGFTAELVRTIERANRNNYNHMMTVVLRSLEVAAAGRLTRAETSTLLQAAIWHDISKPWIVDGRRGSAALAAAAAKDMPAVVGRGMHAGDLLTHPQESSQMVADNWQDFGFASPEEAGRVARIIGAHWGRDPFYVGVLKGQVDSPEQLSSGDRLLAAMLTTADNSANTGPFEALKIVNDELVQGGFRQPVKNIAQALKGYLKSVIGYYDSNYLPEYGRVIIGNNIREIARMINWIEMDPQQLSFMLEIYDLAQGRSEQNRLNAGFAAATFGIILKNYDEVRHDPHFSLLDIDVTPEGEIKRVTDPVAHLVARYEEVFKEPFFTAQELAARPQALAAYAAENLVLAGLNQEKLAHTFVAQLLGSLFRRR